MKNISGLEAKTIVEHLQRRQPGQYSDGPLRILQQRIKVWRASSGPAKEVFFTQIHYPGQLGITIGRRTFYHLIYHFVLTYSNWETRSICFSENFESLSEGLQNVLWKLGGDAGNDFVKSKRFYAGCRNVESRRFKKSKMRVGPSSTIRVNHNVYSVDSRLIREQIIVHQFMDRIEIWHGQKKVDTLPRLRGEGNHRINYRHVIDSLVRKPGAFENYRYREDLFPTSRFRIAYDELNKRHSRSKAVKQYLKILYLEARENEGAVDDTLRVLIDQHTAITLEQIETLVRSKNAVPTVTEIHSRECGASGLL